MPQLDTSFYISQLFWLIISFGALYCFVNFWFVPKVNALIMARKSFVDHTIHEARMMQAEAKKLEDACSQELVNFRLQIEQIHRQTKASCDNLRREYDAIVLQKFMQDRIAAEKDLASVLSMFEKERQDIVAKVAQMVSEAASKSVEMTVGIGRG